ncbi:T9SS type A sorting domain-containing protein [Lewinella sp. IMCC34183]|uniref:T9SS type A sorting domain-containing protein n=1 Tax=Lewinella sp. IMCC34183 TaxID=2248762 RepID=UPI000E227812|nr:T9SS type A sorting domain-containing protein [Lewinella sp. IMCC34183]
MSPLINTILRLTALSVLVALSAIGAAQTPTLTAPSVSPIAIADAGAISEISVPRIALADAPGSCGKVSAPIVSTHDPQRMVGMRVYPNPLVGWAKVELPEIRRAGELQLINQLGQQVWSQQYAPEAGKLVDLQLPTVPPGVYLLLWRVGGQVLAAERVVKVRN